MHATRVVTSHHTAIMAFMGSLNSAFFPFLREYSLRRRSSWQGVLI